MRQHLARSQPMYARFVQALALLGAASHCDRNEDAPTTRRIRSDPAERPTVATVPDAIVATATATATAVPSATALPSSTAPVLAKCLCDDDPLLAGISSGKVRACFVGERSLSGLECSTGPSCDCPGKPARTGVATCPATLTRCGHERPFVGVGPLPPPDLPATTDHV